MKYLVLLFMMATIGVSAESEKKFKFRNDIIRVKKCQKAEDCFVGCRNGETDPRESICLTKDQGSNACMKDYVPPPGGLVCGCLEASSICGYGLMNVMKK